MVFAGYSFDVPYAGEVCSPARGGWTLHPYQSLESQAGGRGLRGGREAGKKEGGGTTDHLLPIIEPVLRCTGGDNVEYDWSREYNVVECEVRGE